MPEALTIINSASRGPLVLTCEHASCAVPVEYDDLGLDDEQLTEHIGWDIGAGALTQSLARELGAPACTCDRVDVQAGHRVIGGVAA